MTSADGPLRPDRGPDHGPDHGSDRTPARTPGHTPVPGDRPSAPRAHLRPVVGVVGGLALAAAATAGPAAVAAAALLVVGGLALGWGAVADVPPGARAGAGAVTALAGAGAVLATALAGTGPHLRPAAPVLAAAVLAAFGAQMLRRDGRTRLVESLAATVTGAVLAVAAAGWVASARAPSGAELVAAAGLALAAAWAVTLGPVAGRLPARAAVLAAPVAGAAAGALVTGSAVGGGAGVVAGLLVGVVAALPVTALAAAVPAGVDARSRRAAVALGALPVAAAGVVAYAVGRLLVG
ncbi:hypothetical protein [Cellulomonas endophytica]|uniref:hypothetical protein n=1 Tax=Cellulomonas endophytica TaxID=2494735 RepID=UPI0010104054|nr:hypothetical protein [Cellulomonas endophytica]